MIRQQTMNAHSPTKLPNESPGSTAGNSPDHLPVSWPAANSSRNTPAGNALSSDTSTSTPTLTTPPSTAPHTPFPSHSPHTVIDASSPFPRKWPRISRTPTPPVPLLQNDVSIEEELIRSFVRLDGQGLFFGLSPSIPPLLWDIHKIWHLPIPATSFPDVASAQRCWDFLMDRSLQFYRRMMFHRSRGTSDLTPAEMSRGFDVHIKALSDFETAFQPILDAAISSTSSSSGEVLNPSALLISLYLKTTYITLAIIPTNSEMIYDSHLPSFKHIVDISSRIITAQTATGLPRNNRFSFDVGIIPPLHVTMMKCRDGETRRRAMELLFRSPRQEGIWDGVLSARIGRWVIGVEEEQGRLLGIPPPPLPMEDVGDYSQQTNGSMPMPMLSYNTRTKMRESGRNRSSCCHRLSSPNAMDEKSPRGHYQDDRSEISHIVHETSNNNEPPKGRHSTLPSNKSATKNSTTHAATPPKIPQTIPQTPTTTVPEENRVRLTHVDFHIPDRYIVVRCQRVISSGRDDGTREERETVIAW